MTFDTHSHCLNWCPKQSARSALHWFAGDGVVKDVAKAFAIFKAGADQGLGEFCYRLGTCYRDAAGTPKLPKNKSVASQLFSQAHAAGVVEATLAMVDCYATGTKLETASLERRHEHTTILDFQSTYCIYHTGYGVVQNKARALSLLESAAATSHAEAMYRLGKCLLEGTLAAEATADNAEDERRAFALFERAQAMGHAEAREMMAVCLESGVGVDAADAERATAVRASAVHAQREDP